MTLLAFFARVEVTLRSLVPLSRGTIASGEIIVSIGIFSKWPRGFLI